MIQLDYESNTLFNPGIKYKLSSVLGEDNFFYGLFEIGSDKLVKSRFITDLPKAFYKDREYFTSILKEEKLLTDPIEEAVFALNSPDFNLLPTALDEGGSHGWTDPLNPKILDNENVVLHNKIIDRSVKVSFLCSKTLKEFLEELPYKIQIVHINAALIEWLQASNVRDAILFNWFGPTFQTVVIKEGMLQQSNNYKLTGEHDALYFALLNCGQHGFVPSKDQFCFSGPIPENGQQIDLFKQHFKHLTSFGEDKRTAYSNVFLGKSKHLFLNLQATLACVS